MGRKKILYIEDNPANVLFMTQLIRRCTDCELLSESNARSGLRMLEQQPFDLLLLDINLPDMNGFDVLAKMRTMPELRKLPVIALSADAMPEQIAKGKAAGFEAYLTKPLEIAALLDQLGKSLGRAPD